VKRRALPPVVVGPMRILRRNMPRQLIGDLYHLLLSARWSTLLAVIIVLYFGSNLVFALGYYLDPGGVENAQPGSFGDAFFFSVQTMATIGYGKMTPVSMFAHLLVTFEALVGLLAFAVGTGLIFAKFSRPTARVLFSHSAVVTVFNGEPALLFRMANQRGTQIVEARLHVVLTRDETTREGNQVRRLIDLPLARDRSPMFSLTWTAVHVIDDKSPFLHLDEAAFRAGQMQLIVSLTGIEEGLAATVHARYVYDSNAVRWNMRMADVITRLPSGDREIDYARFHDLVAAEHKLPTNVTAG
jgi:inward rectifier potassium channel